MPAEIKKDDRYYLCKALSLAKENIHRGGGPFGAIVVKDGELVAETANQVVALRDPTAHAEILAIREAAAKLSTFDLSGCVLYASCEPCPMCLGAIYWAGIKKVIYASDRKDAADAGFQDEFIYREMHLDPSSRQVKFTRALPEEGKDIFIEWRSFEGKIPY